MPACCQAAAPPPAAGAGRQGDHRRPLQARHQLQLQGRDVHRGKQAPRSRQGPGRGAGGGRIAAGAPAARAPQPAQAADDHLSRRRQLKPACLLPVGTEAGSWALLALQHASRQPRHLAPLSAAGPAHHSGAVMATRAMCTFTYPFDSRQKAGPNDLAMVLPFAWPGG